MKCFDLLCVTVDIDQGVVQGAASSGGWQVGKITFPQPVTMAFFSNGNSFGLQSALQLNFHGAVLEIANWGNASKSFQGLWSIQSRCTMELNLKRHKSSLSGQKRSIVVVTLCVRRLWSILKYSLVKKKFFHFHDLPSSISYAKEDLLSQAKLLCSTSVFNDLFILKHNRRICHKPFWHFYINK